ncbi:hypothetical protein HRbin17_00958 [bacterium HR17]|uniref:PrcB C-terminal domain-containing protein n=1 Tax=Candidatus Fervidibacter japonicus TaxID=2035412 RepID=A0A2H5XB77_9BACT|nr:hypothetical protein HRbin17_00958 [bacterium HR17]
MCRLAVACWLGVLAAWGFSATPERAVIVISWDGGKPSVMRQLVQRGQLPTVQALMQEGTYTLTAQTIVPSSTLPSHASMLTGLRFERHGVNWNSYIPERGAVKATTVFELAKRAGLRTAMVFSKEKFKHFAKPNTVDVVEYVRGNAEKVAEVAVRVLTTQKPNLLFVHFHDPDSAGHAYGWGNEAKGVPPSDEFLAALRRCDEATGAIVRALKAARVWQTALVIVTADHGGHDRTHGTANPEDVYIPWIAAGGLAAKRGEIKQTVRTMDTAATALAALKVAVPPDWDGQPVSAALQDGSKVAMTNGVLPIVAEWRGVRCGVTKPQLRIVTNARDWSDLWRQVHRVVRPAPPVPSIDFTRYTVLAVFAGQKPTGGYTIRITRVTLQGQKAVVFVREEVPERGAFVTHALTQPFHIVAVPRVNANVQFIAQRICDQ